MYLKVLFKVGFLLKDEKRKVKVSLQEIVGSDRDLAKVSDVDRRTNTIHVRSTFSFARCAFARPKLRRLSRSNGERFSPCFGR